MFARSRQTFALMLALASPLTLQPASATDGHSHKGPNGGQIVDADDRHIEFVAAGSEISVYITDHADKPIATQGATGKAIVQVGGKTATVTLAPAEANRLVGKAEAVVGKGAKVIVSTTLANGKSLQGRFVVP